MNPKFPIQRSLNQRLPENSATPVDTYCASSSLQFPTAFADYFGKLGTTAIKQQQLHEISPPKVAQLAATQPNLLTRALAWLNTNRSTPRRLRVLETVTLGDKRLVAVIQAEGRRFLVGGGPSGVSLLTPLDQAYGPHDDFEPSVGLTELAG